jgi:IQ and ubiquitin-like domain-containing protein
LKLVKFQESQKQQKEGRETTQQCISLLQESDMRYLVDVIWNHKSAISGVRNLEDLILTRWNIQEELTPWNCILLTKAEAMTHDLQSNPEDIYSIEFRNKVFQKQLVARQHFSMLPKMGQYVSSHYTEKQGKFVIQAAQTEHQIAC